jgi:hypothetical protein
MTHGDVANITISQAAKNCSNDTLPPENGDKGVLKSHLVSFQSIVEHTLYDGRATLPLESLVIPDVAIRGKSPKHLCRLDASSL